MAGTRPSAGGTICVLGDAHLDVVVRVSGPVAAETDTPAQTQVGVGGQAANVAAWIAGLGGRSRLIAARGRDPAAQLVAAELARRGVDLAGPVLDGRTGVVVSLSHGGRSRSMLTDRGVGPSLEAAAVDARWLAGCAWLHLPAYSLVSWPVRDAALAAATPGRAPEPGPVLYRGGGGLRGRAVPYARGGPTARRGVRDRGRGGPGG